MYIYSNLCKQMTNVKLLHSNTWNHLIVQKMSSGLFKIINKMCLQIIYVFNLYV